MILRKLDIENFRCYYKTNSFVFNEGLTLIIGGNGDGKTTLFEALEWLFEEYDTSNSIKGSEAFISKKRLEELDEQEEAQVSVSLSFEHDGEKQIVKRFRFKKEQGELVLFDIEFQGYEDLNYQRVPVAGKELLDRCFDGSIRKYCLFKGEANLNVFNSKEALKFLVDTYSNGKIFQDYINFTKYMSNQSNKVYANKLKNDQKSVEKAKQLSDEIEELKKNISQIESELDNATNEIENYASLIDKIEKNKNNSEYLNSINERIDLLESERRNIIKRIKDNYSVRLLDDLWITCGFEPVFKDFKKVVTRLSKEKRQVEDEFVKEQGKKEAIEGIQNELINNGITPLALYVPDEDTMQEMISEEFCKVCGRRAEKGSKAYEFMVGRLEEFLKSKEEGVEKTCKEDLFINTHIEDLDKLKIFYNSQCNFAQLRNQISEDVKFNLDREKELVEIEQKIAKEEASKARLLAQVDGITEEELKSVYNRLNSYWSSKEDLVRKEESLRNEYESLTTILAEKNKAFHALGKNGGLETFSKASSIFAAIYEAFESAKKINTENLICQIEKEANAYLAKLNEGDFKGVIRIVRLTNGAAKFELVDDSGKLFQPNTALETTVNMAVLFAISELTALKRENNYPLIFDAPTSSFEESKEKDFFDIISKLDKQCIIVTKSFLKQVEGNRSEVKIDSLEALEGTIYRITKKEPFNDTDIATIQTQISCLKN